MIPTICCVDFAERHLSFHGVRLALFQLQGVVLIVTQEDLDVSEGVYKAAESYLGLGLLLLLSSFPSFGLNSSFFYIPSLLITAEL